MISFYDIHAHYTDSFYKDLCVDIESVVKECFKGNSYRIICSGTSPQNSREAIELSKKFPGMAVSVGIHPTNAFYIEDCDYALSEIELLLKTEIESIAAVGEIGLDYYHKKCLNKEKQKYFFEKQLELSLKYNLPAVIHCRDAIGDCVEILKSYKNAYGAMHCFSGSPETAKELVKMGWLISIAGNVTYNTSDKLREVVKAVGIEHLLTETDAPFMTPEGLRGTMNNSQNIIRSAKVIAEVLGMQTKDVARITRENADSLFCPAKFAALNNKRAVVI